MKSIYPVFSFREIEEILSKECRNCTVIEKHGRGDNKVLILPEAFKELKTMITYGRESPMNVKEQKFAGFGHFIKDSLTGYVIIISHFIEILTKNRSRVNASNLGPNGEYNDGLGFLEYHREEFIKGERTFNKDEDGYLVDPFLPICGSSEFCLEGHTHPNLGVFLSTQDRESGAARASKSPVCVFVCNPIRKEMLGVVGNNFEASEVLVYSHKTGMSLEISSGRRDNDLIGELSRLSSRCLELPGCKESFQAKTTLGGK